MHKRWGLVALLLAVALGVGVVLWGGGQTPPASARDIDELLATMSLEQKVGQMVMAGFPGYSAGSEATQLIRQHHVGGVILFARNIRDPVQVANLTRSLQQLAQSSGARIPLFIATDQEGGIVARLRSPAAVMPGAMALGAASSPELAYEAGRSTARQLLAVGINMNFAPVVDVNNNPANPVIGVRSFGEDPELVAELGAAFIRGQQEEGVISTAKHFPGHGDTDTDSHIALPRVDHPRERLDQVELVPFRAAIAAGVDAIMTAHVTFPSIDPTPGLPATLSHRVLTGLLREELGHEGLIVTDAMEMQAITANFGIAEAAVRAVEAGADMVLVAWPADWYDAVRVTQALVAAARSGRISQERIDASVERILRLKLERGLFDVAPVSATEAAERVGRPEDHALALEIARAAVTVVKDEQGAIPLEPKQSGKVLVVTPQLSDLTQAEERGTSLSTLGEVVRRRIPDAQEIVIGTSPSVSQRSQVVLAARDADTIIIGTYRANQNQALLVNDLRRMGKRLIVVALREPYDLLLFPDMPTYVATYGYLPVHMEALGEVLFGDAPARGRLPVSLPGLTTEGK